MCNYGSSRKYLLKVPLPYRVKCCWKFQKGGGSSTENPKFLKESTLSVNKESKVQRTVSAKNNQLYIYNYRSGLGACCFYYDTCNGDDDDDDDDDEDDDENDDNDDDDGNHDNEE